MRILSDKILLILLILIISFPAFAELGNWTKFISTETTVNRPFDIPKVFAKDEICGYPAPYIGGVLVTPWQSVVRSRYSASDTCPGGSVKSVSIQFQYSVTTGNSYQFDFRHNANASSAGDQAATDAASYNQAGILARAWEAKMVLTPYPASSTATAKTIDGRDFVTRGKFRYRKRGPVMTQIVIENTDTDRADDFGWRETSTARLMENLEPSTDTSFRVLADWSGIARPFQVQLNFEIVMICYASYNGTTGETTLTVGTTNGVSPACATNAGRGSNAYNHYANEKREIVYLRNTSLYHASGFTSTSTGNTSITVNDASAITDVTILKANWELLRICNKSGNTLTIGTAAWPCAANASGRAWWGTRYAGKVNDADSGGNYVVNGGLDNWTTKTDVWTDAHNSRYKGLHAVIVLSIWNNWAAESIEWQIYNPWWDRLQQQIYTASFERSGGITPVVITGVLHGIMSSWKYPDGPIVGTYQGSPLYIADRKAWDGTAPGAGRYDHNFKYLRYTGVIPWDASVSVDATGIDHLVGSTNYPHQDGTSYGWLNSDKGAIPQVGLWNNLNHRANCAAVFKGLGSVGGRPDIAPAPQWQVAGLYAMNSNLSNADKWEEGFFGNAACNGYLPYTIWEPTTDKNFCNPTDTSATYKSCAGTNLNTNAFGRPVSIDARPNFGMWDDQNNNGISDRILYVGMPSLNDWANVDGNAHWPLQNYLAFLIGGDYYHERGLLDETARSLHYAASSPPSRKGSWGLPNWYNMSRPISWHLRNMLPGTFMQVNGSPEEEYLMSKIRNFVEKEEGRYNITDGMYYRPCAGGGDISSTIWCYGRMTEMKGSTDNEFSVPGFGNVASWGWNDFGNSLQTKVFHVKSYWMDNFGLIAVGWGLGMSGGQFDFFKPLFNRVYFRDVVERAINPVYGPYLNGEYRDPFIPCRPEGTVVSPNCSTQTFNTGEQRFYANYAYLRSSWNATALAKTSYDNDGDKQGGYSVIFSAAVMNAGDVISGNNRQYTGKRAINWIRSGGERYRWQRSGGMLAFAVSPRQEHVVNLKAFPTSGGNLRFIVESPDGGACTGRIFSTHPASTAGTSNLSTDDNISISAGSKEKIVTLTGQSVGSKILRVHCTVSRGEVAYTQN